MDSPAIYRPSPTHTQRWQRLSTDQRFRGLRVEQNVLAAYTMYIVELDQLGLFISDSRAAALDMALDALCGCPASGSGAPAPCL